MGSCSHSGRKATDDKAKKTVFFVHKDETAKDSTQGQQCPEQRITQTIFGKNNKGYGDVYFGRLSCVAASLEKHISFADQTENDNEVEVQEAQDDFDTLLHKTFTEFMTPAKGDSTSRLYVPIVQAINRLNEMKADNKVYVMIGDAVEYSNEGNFYKNSFLKNGIPDTAKVNAQVRSMEKIVVLPDNPKNLKVYFLFNAKQNKKDEYDHDNAMAVWHALFAKHGITLIELANL